MEVFEVNLVESELGCIELGLRKKLEALREAHPAQGAPA
jgi:hypothetical protein